jgi:hypothetical protein
MGGCRQPVAYSILTLASRAGRRERKFCFDVIPVSIRQTAVDLWQQSVQEFISVLGEKGRRRT